MTSRSVRTGKRMRKDKRNTHKAGKPAGDAEVEPLETDPQSFQALGWSQGCVCTEVKTLQIAAVRAVYLGGV